jgi:Response regulator containing a CheY-like receiver domain and an HD-GYP domain
MAESKKNEENVIASLLRRAKNGSRDLSAHVERSYDLARRFGRELGLSEEQAADLKMLIRLHDIGMAALPREVVTKTGPLTEEDWKLIRKHPEAGFEIMRSFADTARISDAVLAHDEHWDGSGYPRGLAKDKIPYLARVFALIEAYDVMTHSRPYGRRFTPEEAADEVRRCAGTQFDPALVDIFINVAVPVGAR